MTTSTDTVERSSFFSLLWIMLFDHTSLNIIFPVLTLIFFDNQSRLFSPETSEAIRSHWYGLCIAIPHAVNFLCAPLLGILSDCYGRKNILLVASLGALFFALTAAFSVLYGSLTLLFIACFIRGMFSRTNPVAQAVVGDLNLFSEHSGIRQTKIVYMGYLQTAISLGAFLGPVLGGHLAMFYAFNQFNFSLPFFVAAGFAWVAFCITAFRFQETLKNRQPLAIFKRLSQLTQQPILIHSRLVTLSAILFFSQISWSLYYQFIPPTLKIILHANQNLIGDFVGWIAIWLAVATLLGIRILNQFYNTIEILLFSLILLLIGTVCTVLFFMFSFFHHTQILLWVTAVPVAAGDGIAFSCLCTLYSDAVNKQEQGRIMGLCFIVIAAVWTLTAIIGGHLFAINHLFPLWIAPIGTVLALWMVLKNDLTLYRC